VIDVAVVGLGKMGLSHLAMARAHPDVNLQAVCDSSGYVLDILGKYTGLRTFTDYADLLDKTHLDAIIIATPSHLHATMVRQALEKGLHVFCEKPFCLDDAIGAELTELAGRKELVTQVGYHNRFVASFREVKSLLDGGSIGPVTHVLAEAYGPVVLKPKGGTWRSRRSSGGGCLYDYAAHPIDLVSWYLGEPIGVGGSVMKRVFSNETDDQVASTLYFTDGRTAQVSANWSDASQRKMTTTISVWGSHGHIFADRQEIQVYLREGAQIPEGYQIGWNVRYTTDLTDPVWYYLRGEEYSAQIDNFVRRVATHEVAGTNTFEQAAITDKVISMIIDDAARGPATHSAGGSAMAPRPPHRRRWWARLMPLSFPRPKSLSDRRP